MFSAAARRAAGAAGVKGGAEPARVKAPAGDQPARWRQGVDGHVSGTHRR